MKREKEETRSEKKTNIVEKCGYEVWKEGKKKEMRNFKKNSWKNEIENNNVARLKRRK